MIARTSIYITLLIWKTKIMSHNLLNCENCPPPTDWMSNFDRIHNLFFNLFSFLNSLVSFFVFVFKYSSYFDGVKLGISVHFRAPLPCCSSHHTAHPTLFSRQFAMKLSPFDWRRSLSKHHPRPCTNYSAILAPKCQVLRPRLHK